MTNVADARDVTVAGEKTYRMLRHLPGDDSDTCTAARCATCTRAPDGLPADGRQRPDLRVRLRAADADPGQGPRCSPSCRCGGSSSSPTWCPTTWCRPTCPRSSPAAGVLCRRLEMFPVECVARGYLTGSGLAEYRATGVGLRRRRCRPAWWTARELPEPIFTPGDQGRAWATTTRTWRTTTWSPPSAPTPLPSCAGSRSRSTAGPTTSRASAGSSSPTPSSSSAATATAGSCWPTRCSRRTRRASGPPTSGEPGRAAAVVRQAVRPRLAHLAGLGLGPQLRRAAAAAARRGGRAHPGEVPRGLRAADRPQRCDLNADA